MGKRTDYSGELVGKILGLRNFIETAEADRINALVEQDPSYYYNILPYAYVLGVTDKWAKNFEKINIQPPSWYYGNTADGMFMDAWFYSSMMRNCSTAVATADNPTSGSAMPKSRNNGSAVWMPRGCEANSTRSKGSANTNSPAPQGKHTSNVRRMDEVTSRRSCLVFRQACAAESAGSTLMEIELDNA